MACAAITALLCACAGTMRGAGVPDERTTYSAEHGWAKLDRAWDSTSAVDVDAKGNLWVFDIPGVGPEPEKENGPEGVAADSDGNIYGEEIAQRSVTRFSRD
jgi:hypothetical protein